MVSTSPRLRCSSGSRLSEERMDRDGAGVGKGMDPQGRGRRRSRASGSSGLEPWMKKVVLSQVVAMGMAGRKGAVRRRRADPSRY